MSQIRKCKFCEKEFPTEIEMVRSVATGDWICSPCFNVRIRGNSEITELKEPEKDYSL